MNRTGQPTVDSPAPGGARQAGRAWNWAHWIWCCLFGLITIAGGGAAVEASPLEDSPTAYIVPIREDIMPPLVYLVRRGVKAAIEGKAAVLILDMDTNGGRLDTTEEIISILNEFKGKTVTYVDHKAFSAGAFIAVATQKIYMAPQSVIGAAAPLIMMPGSGPVEVPQTVEAKMTSGVRALVRANAEKNGYNVDVIEAMIDKNKELEIDGEVLNEKGQILTLTNTQAEKKYGQPPQPLLSSGTIDDMEGLLGTLGLTKARAVRIEPTGAEKFGRWLNALSPLLLIIGIIGIYLEFKSPGFALPGIVGVTAFVLYFLGGYVAGLSGMEWIGLFAIGLVLLILELFVFPGITVLGLSGVILILIAIVMAMVDVYPTAPGIPFSLQFRFPVGTILFNLGLTMVGCILAIWCLSLVLPKTNLYSALVSHSVSGEASVVKEEQQQRRQVGEVGVAISPLRPGGKAQFGELVLDVVSQGDLIDNGSKVRIIGHSGTEAIVERVA